MNSFRIDLHVHTRESSICGRTEGRLVAQLYKKAGYDGIVITDHYNRSYFRKFPKSVPWSARIDHFLRGYRAARKEGEEIGLTVLLGIELKFVDSPREFLVYGIDETFLKQNPELYQMGLAEFRKFSTQFPSGKEILIYQAHPFRPGISPAPLDLIDGIEVYNGNPRQNSNNQMALAFAQQNKLRMISGSDFHRLPDLARGGLILPEAVADTRALVRVLKQNEGITLITDDHVPFSILRLVTCAGNLVKKLVHQRNEDF